MINQYVTRAQHVTIHIDLPPELTQMDKKFTQKLPGMMRRIAMEGKSFWKSEAGRKLKSSRNVYQDGIKLDVISPTTFSLRLEGFLAVSVESGNSGFDMKPGFLKNAKPLQKRKIPAAIAKNLPQKSAATMYRIIPLNVNRYVNMQKPKVFRTVTDASPAESWRHPGWKGMQIADSVITELDTNIIPRHLATFLKEVL